MSTTPRVVALLGNPNVGKTTLFNALTGFRARVGNYPGVTVERKSGSLKDSPVPVDLVDLPGTYSLAARSLDEMIAADLLLGRIEGERRPDAVILVADASNLERNLFLVTQVLELGLPAYLVLNLMDAAAEAGIRIDAAQLSARLGLPVFTCVASKGTGLGDLRAALAQADLPKPAPAPAVYPPEFNAEVEHLAETFAATPATAAAADPFMVGRALLEVGGVAGARLAEAGGEAAEAAIRAGRDRLADKGHRVQTLEARARYKWIREQLSGIVEVPATPRETFSDRLDKILIHRLWGTLIFALGMLLVFQAIYSWSGPLMDAIDGTFAWLGGVVGERMAEGPLQSLVVDGVIAGVGGVVIFLPQILILFLFVAVLEDCGYMARAAFLMDRLLSKCGLSGRSFIPMLSSFACAIPGIMATRTIEDRNDRIATILVAPLMSCSARLPVYVLFIGAFVPEKRVLGGLLNFQGLVLFAMYLVGAFVAIPVALILKRTLLKARTPSFLMELPPYKTPQAATVLHRMYERGVAFLQRAGTVILAVSIVIWAATYYPRPSSVGEEAAAEHEVAVASTEAALSGWLAEHDTDEDALAAEGAPEDGVALLEARDAAAAEQEAAVAGAYLRQSVLGRMGRVLEPVVRPLGWDWRIAMAVVASFPAREVVVATLGVIYDVGTEADEESVDLREKLQVARWPDGRPVFGLAVALSVMVFFALCSQCAATLAIIRRETNSWRWPLFAFTYMTGLAYIGALITYQVSRALIG